MAHNITWYVPNQVVFIIFYGDITVADLHNINSFMMRHLEKSPHPIHTIVDAANVAKVHASPSELSASIPYLSHKRLGWNTILHTNSFTRFLASMVFQMTHTRACFPKNHDEAIHFLSDMDDTIQWNLAVKALPSGF